MSRGCWIYLVEAQNGMVKIGCSERPFDRLRTIRTHSPVLVRLIGVWPGELIDERNLHRRFKNVRSHNEWFFLEGDMVNFLQEMHGRGVDEVNHWDALRFVPNPIVSANTREKRSARMKAAWVLARKNPTFGSLGFDQQRKKQERLNAISKPKPTEAGEAA